MYMNFHNLVQMLSNQGYFDLATVVQLTGENRESIRMQLYRWCKAGKLISLRRGMYVLPEAYRSVPLNPAELANQLYRPSYISTYWAIGFFGLIPEKVVTYTSVTTRVPRSFENPLGTFTYRHIKPTVFFGYRSLEIDGWSVMIAEPEKALLDLWYLEKGEWDKDRMAAMRFQNCETLDTSTLRRFAEPYQSPRLLKATAVWFDAIRSQDEGTVTL